MVEMELLGVRVEVPATTPVLVMREKGVAGPPRMLQIFIAGPEATAIAVAMEGIQPRRPLTHDLLKTLLQEFGGELEQVVITEVHDGVFYAELHIATTGGTGVVSCRPSDAIALAVRTQSPIYAAETVLAEAGYVEPDEIEGEAMTEDMVQMFREFIENVEPEDFEP